MSGQPASEGEICLRLDPRPVNLMAGYLGDDVRTDLVCAGGYYHTGDVASRDDDGYISYIGRTDDVFKASDYKISPFELESVLIEHPAVVEAAVVPAPDPIRLAVPKAYISLAAGGFLIGPLPTRFSPMPTETLLRINASGASNSWNYRRPSPARSAVSSCELAKVLVHRKI